MKRDSSSAIRTIISAFVRKEPSRIATKIRQMNTPIHHGKEISETIGMAVCCCQATGKNLLRITRNIPIPSHAVPTIQTQADSRIKNQRWENRAWMKSGKVQVHVTRNSTAL